MTLNELRDAAYANAVAKGFHEKPRSVSDGVSLLHSECSEILEDARDGHAPTDVWYEEKRKNGDTTIVTRHSKQVFVDSIPQFKPCGIGSEIIDVLIRAFDFAGEHGIDLDTAYAEKAAYNATRKPKHGKKF